MAGSPLKRLRNAAIAVELQRRAESEDVTELDYVESFLASGGTLVDLADDITRKSKPKTEVNREQVRKYVVALAPDASERIARARVHGGSALLEQSTPIADSATPDDVQVAKLRIETRRFIAGVLDPSIREQKGLSVHISAGSLHLDALRHANRPATAVLSEVQPSTSLPSQVVDAQEVEVG